MKVALVIEHYDPARGGAEGWTDTHARRLVDAGHDVHVVARSVRALPPGATAHVLDDAAGGMAPGDPHQRVAATIDAQAFDVVHDMGYGWHGDLFMPHHGVRRVLYGQKSRLLMPPERWLRPLAYRCYPRYRRFERIERRQYRRPEAASSTVPLFIAVSRMVRAQMMRYHGVPEDRIRVVHNGVDTARFQPATSGADTPRAKMREVWGCGEDDVVFLIVAHDFQLKGVPTLMEAVRRLADDGHPVHLVVVGPGEHRARKVWGVPVGRAHDRGRALAQRWGHQGIMHFAGRQDDTAPYYQAADVYVQPTLFDACSLVVLEALATGLPVITSRCNGAGELLHDGVEGFLVGDPQDATALAGRMTELLDPHRREGFGAAARRLAEQCSGRCNFERMLEIYAEVRARKAAHGELPRTR